MASNYVSPIMICSSSQKSIKHDLPFFLSINQPVLSSFTTQHVFTTRIHKPRKCFITNSTTSHDNTSSAETPIELKHPAFPTVFNINQLREVMPHRFPFFLVDRVIECTPVSVVAIKNLTMNENFFLGHFPEKPIMPGVLMVEALAQVGGLLMLHAGLGAPRQIGLFAGADKVRFRKTVIPGDTLVMRMTLVKFQKLYGLAKMEGKAYVDGEVVCEGEFKIVLSGDFF